MSLEPVPAALFGGGHVVHLATLPATFRLTPGVWYQVTLEADYGASTYRNLSVSTAGMLMLS